VVRVTRPGTAEFIVALALASGCESSVMLGDQCPSRVSCGGSELQVDGGHGKRDAGHAGHHGDASGQDAAAAVADAAVSARDAGVDALQDGGPADDDAGPPSDDASSDASDAGTLFPGFGNPSFELQNGSAAGDVAGANPPDLSPWQTCEAPGQVGLMSAEQDAVTPSDGDTYVAFTFLYVVSYPAPIYQELPEPLRKGQRYAFMVDLYAQGLDNQLGLIVRGGTSGCSALNDTLAMTPFLKQGVWTPTCVTFTPASDMPQIALLPRAIAGFGAPSTLFVDNIRSDPSCQ
jgi:hypothetical protein